MYRYIKADMSTLPQIHVNFYIEPVFHEDSEIFSAVEKVYDEKSRKYVYKSDNNPDRKFTGPLTQTGEELEQPIRGEFESFIEDCEWIIKDNGFTIIDKKQSTESKKSEYFLFIGLGDKLCGTFVVDFRVSDHVLKKYVFPEEWKDRALEYLKMNNIVDKDFTKEKIDFKFDHVTIGTVVDDTWDGALNRIYRRLKSLRTNIQNRQSN